MGDKREKARIKDPKRVCKKKKKSVNSQEGFESGLQEKLGSGTREDKEKKKK